MSETTINDEQQFCLRWNNFQANITSQFEALRDDEDFTDVTIACDGKRLQAHRVVLSACSPFFKELFKTNPCSHPIIFMRDVEACHIQALMEFMYAGEVNVAQAHLSGFLKTAESLKIRGLTDTTTNERIIKQQQKGETFKTITTNFNDNNSNNDANKSKLIDNNSNNDTNSLQQQQPITSSHQDITNITAPTTITTTPAPPPPPPPLLTSTIITPTTTTKISSPPPKRQCKSDSDLSRLKQIKSIDNTSDNNLMLLNTFNIQQQQHDNHNQIELSNIKAILQPKLELPDYLSDDDNKELGNIYATPADVTELAGGMEIIPQMSTYSSSLKETTQDSVQPSADTRKLHSLDPRPCEECGRVYSNLSNLRQHMKLIHYPTIVQCPICKKPFKTDLYLRRHLSSAHDGYYNTNNSNRIMDNPTIRNITPIITTSTTTTPTTAAISTPSTTTAHDYKSFCKNDLKYELRSAT